MAYTYNDSPVSPLIINTLTKDQYDNIIKNDNELYFVTGEDVNILPATTTSLGVMQVGNGLQVDTNGLVSVSSILDVDITGTAARATLADTATNATIAISANSLDNKFYPNRMRNDNRTGVGVGAPPINVLALINSGYAIYSDSEFASGNNSVSVYNNAGNGNVSITRVADSSAANTSGYILKIQCIGTAAPGWGGFYQNITSRSNAIFAQIFRAKIPVGYDVHVASNSLGTGYSDYWITDTAGTGKWEWYCRISSCGESGSFSSGGHVYLTGGNTPTSSDPIIWYLGYCNCFDLTKGAYLQATKIYGAVWNDYAEYRDQLEEIKPGYCATANNNGKLFKTTKKLQACDGIVSDTFGFAIGETDSCKTPLAVAGRVLAYYNDDINNYHFGDAVCAGPNGKICKMTDEEIKNYPHRIIGTVSEIPTYETWGTGTVSTKDRIWIKVK